MLLQWHVIDPDHSANSARWQLTDKQACTFDPTKSEWADYAVQAIYSAGTYKGKERTGSLSGVACPQSSQLAEPLWTDSGLNNGISARKPIFFLFSFFFSFLFSSFQRSRGMIRRTPPPPSSHERKKPTTRNNILQLPKEFLP